MTPTSVPPPPPPAKHQAPNPHTPSLPEGWLESERGSGNVCGLCPVKTPLSSTYDPRLTAEQRWTPAQCVAACGKRKVVVVIDLTATDRYYDKRELAALGVRHVKIATQGRGVPSERQMGEVLDVLREVMPSKAQAEHQAARDAASKDGDEERARALEELASAVSGDTVTLGGGAVSGGQAAVSGGGGGKDANSIAIIHCTHGLNRTGYVITRALVELQGYSLVDALAAFAAVRPPGLWRAEYVKALHERYGGPQPELPKHPRQQNYSSTAWQRPHQPLQRRIAVTASPAASATRMEQPLPTAAVLPAAGGALSDAAARRPSSRMLATRLFDI